MTERRDIRFQFGPFMLDPVKRVLEKEGSRVRIRPKAFDILRVLAQAQGRLVAKDDLMKAVWPDSFVEESNLTLQVSLLRKVLGDAGPEHCYICNIPGRGYQLVAPVTEVAIDGVNPHSESLPRAVATGSELVLPPLPLGSNKNGNTPPEGTFPQGPGTTSVGTARRNGAIAHRDNLPLQPTRLIGRDDDVKLIKALLSELRMITLLGAPGAGKTRLGIRTARELAAEFPDGVFLIELASIRDPDLVASAIAHTIGLQETGTTPVTDLLKDHLDRKQMLLLLDNFEHLLAAAVLVADLLASASEFRVLATSRAALDISWEQQYFVEPLAVPAVAPVAQTVSLRPYHPKANHTQAEAYATLDSLRQCPSVALFLQRARAVKPDFDLNAENASAVAELCRRLDGLPLAIELITAHVKTFSPVNMLERLERDTTLLAGAHQDRPLRHQTMQMAIESSHELLCDAERVLFRRLAVFVGGFTLEAAEAVCGREEGFRFDVGRALWELINKSLVGRTDSGTEPRFAMLEVIREYGLQRLQASGESDATHRRHAQFFCALAERNERPRRKGETLDRLLAVLDTEISNLRTAMGWSRDHGDAETVLRIASAMRRFWTTRGSHDEGWRWLDETLSRQVPVSQVTRGKALGASGRLAISRGDYDSAIRLIEEGLTILRGTADQEQVSQLLPLMGEILILTGSHEKAIETLEEAMALCRNQKDLWLLMVSLNDVGIATQLAGQYERSEAVLVQTLSFHRELGDEWGAGSALVNLTQTLIRQDKHADALQYINDFWVLGGVLEHVTLITPMLENSAQVVCAIGNFESAVRILAAAEAGRRMWAIPAYRVEQAANERTLEEARGGLEPSAFRNAWEEGSRMALQEAMELAKRELGPQP